LSPLEAHPSLTLGDYFYAVQQALFQLFMKPAPDIPVKKAPDRIIVRSEKHGALYHVASAELFFGGRLVKFAVSAAVSDKGKACFTMLSKRFVGEFIEGNADCAWNGNE
jgi:hypothetical protein